MPRASTASWSASRSTARRCRSSCRASAARSTTATHVGTVTDLIWSPRLEKNIGYVLGADRSRRGRHAARDRRTRRWPLAGPHRGDPVPRPEEGRAEVMTQAAAHARRDRRRPQAVPRGLAAARPRLPRAGDPRLRATRVVPPGLDARRTRGGRRRRPAPTSWPRSTTSRSSSSGPRRRAARVLQRLPAPRHGGGRGAVRQGRPLPVPVPRLDLRPRGPARPRQAHRGPRRLRPGRLRAGRGPPRDLAGLRVRQPLEPRRRRSSSGSATSCRTSTGSTSAGCASRTR